MSAALFVLREKEHSLPDCLSAIEEKENLGFYEILGLSIAALISAREELNPIDCGLDDEFPDPLVEDESEERAEKERRNRELSELTDQTLKISIEEVPELESESIEDIVLKAGLIERAKEQLQTVLNKVSDSDVVERIRKIQEEKVQPGRNIKG